MSRVTYFQRFSQPENHATNNTLLLLRYFYESSPFKVQDALNSLLDTELSIGLAFDQQVRTDASTPDALISQAKMSIYIETKRDGILDAGQIRRHMKGIAQKEGAVRGEGTILIGLTKEPIAISKSESLAEEAKTAGIIFCNLTFTQLADALCKQCAEFERELLSVVEDYKDYLEEERLIELQSQKLVVFPCGNSIADNVRLDLYYEPSSRSRKRYQFIGIYKDKTVSSVGKVEAVAIVSYKSGKISLDEEAGHVTEAHRERIKRAIEETRYYNLKSNPHRFYMVDKFLPTDSQKTSPQGIMSFRYLDLSNLIKDKGYDPHRDYSTAEIAELLKGTKWQ